MSAGLLLCWFTRDAFMSAITCPGDSVSQHFNLWFDSFILSLPSFVMLLSLGGRVGLGVESVHLELSSVTSCETLS